MFCGQCGSQIKPYNLPDAITILHMVVGGAEARNPVIESVHDDSKVIKLSQNFEVDLNALACSVRSKSEGRPGIIQRSALYDFLMPCGLQVIDTKEYHAFIWGRPRLIKKRVKEEQKRLREGQSLRWSERLALSSWFLSMNTEQQGANKKIPLVDGIRNGSKSTSTESFATIVPTTTTSSLWNLLDK